MRLFTDVKIDHKMAIGFGVQSELSDAMDLAHIVYWEVDTTTAEFILNNPFYVFYGTTAEREGGYRMSWEEFGKRFVHPDDMPLFQQAASRRLASMEPEFLDDVEHRIIRRDGEVRHILARIRVSRDATGRIIKYYGANQDITEHKQAKEALLKSEAAYRSLFNNMLDGIACCEMIFDDDRPVDFIYLDVNNAFERITGLRDVVGKKVTEVIPGIREAHPGLFEIYGRVVLTGRPERFEIEFKPLGLRLSISVYSAEKNRFVATFDNITARKQAEEVLRESESRFKGAFEASGIGMALVALDGRWLKVNQSFCGMIGYSEQELLAKTFQDITHPDDVGNDLEYVQRLVDDQIPYYRLEKRYCHRDGYIVWGALSVSLVRDAQGRPLYFVGQIEDITERKFLEEKVQTTLITDELTGLYNRKGFFELSWERLKSASKRKQTCTLFLVKLDDIRLVNETLGQKEGDAIIIAVGRMLQETFGEQDVVGRIGGVEFAVFAVGAVNAERAQLPARLRDNVMRWNKEYSADFPISLRVGTARCKSGKSLRLETLMAQADQSMCEERRKSAPMQAPRAVARS
jgi:PAS domain S-box-containing protein/diguanylate cyclase (GGDEF)-like protein